MLSLRYISQNHVNGILLEVLLVGGPPLHLKNTAAPFASPILFRKSFFPSLSPLVLGEVSVQNADTNRYLPPAPITTFWVRARVSTNWLRPTGKPTDHLVVLSVGRSALLARGAVFAGSDVYLNLDEYERDEGGRLGESVENPRRVEIRIRLGRSM